MAVKPVKVILDTNILISALGFGGKPREILTLIIDRKITAVTSPTLMAELADVIAKKFPLLKNDLTKIEKRIEKRFTIVHPRISFDIVRDTADNRVLEAAVEGGCSYIITGDRELLELNTFQNIAIASPTDFLAYFQNQ